MPMLTWLSMHPVELKYSWTGWAVIGFMIACIVALVIIIVKYR